MEDYAAVADMDTHDNDSTCSDLDKLLKEFDSWQKVCSLHAKTNVFMDVDISFYLSIYLSM